MGVIPEPKYIPVGNVVYKQRTKIEWAELVPLGQVGRIVGITVIACVVKLFFFVAKCCLRTF